MELKYENAIAYSGIDMGLNRTFMELKYNWLNSRGCGAQS